MSGLPAGYSLIALDEATSTNLISIERIAAGAALDRQVVWARRQTAGRGRHGRQWHSPDGNLYVSAIYRMEKTLIETAQLGFAAALAAADTIRALTPKTATPAITCKWPNDVLLGGQKTVGILLETHSSDPMNETPDFVVVGIGVNLAEAPTDTPYPATSIAGAFGEAPGVETALSTLIRRLDHWVRIWSSEGFAGLREPWLAQAQGLGKPITVRLANHELSGMFAGIDDAGALVLANDGGTSLVTAGDVFFPPTI